MLFRNGLFHEGISTEQEKHEQFGRYIDNEVILSGGFPKLYHSLWVD
jgi:hypothetical protein